MRGGEGERERGGEGEGEQREGTNTFHERHSTNRDNEQIITSLSNCCFLNISQMSDQSYNLFVILFLPSFKYLDTVFMLDRSKRVT